MQAAEDCLDKAANNGHLDVVKWLSGSVSWTSAGLRWMAASKAAMNGAAAGGHLHVRVFGVPSESDARIID